MDGAKADMVFTDPPYGVKYRDFGKGANTSDKFKKGVDPQFDEISGDGDIETAVLLLRGVLGAASASGQVGCPWYVWHSFRAQAGFESALEDVGLGIKAQIIWRKTRPVLSMAHYRSWHENCFYAVPRGTPFWAGGHDQFSVWDEGNDANKDRVHPTQKPVMLAVKAIENSCPSAGVVADFFGGSGSTLIACEKTGRTAHLMELDPRYCDVIVTRWEKFTGKTAQRPER